MVKLKDYAIKFFEDRNNYFYRSIGVELSNGNSKLVAMSYYFDEKLAMVTVRRQIITREFLFLFQCKEIAKEDFEKRIKKIKKIVDKDC